MTNLRCLFNKFMLWLIVTAFNKHKYLTSMKILQSHKLSLSSYFMKSSGSLLISILKQNWQNPN